MNKTININLGGLFFHIDEEAYKKLRRYLDSISRSLSDDPQGKTEIINDIELRISELLSEKIRDPRQVVSIVDIEEVIEIMGKPEDYEMENAFDEYAQNRTNNRNSRKLYRDGDDKFLGGVCSGLGHYLGVQPVWIRIFFLVLFFGWGTGLLVYIILWALLPEANTTAEKLQMEGEPVNINNIEKRVKQEYENLETKVKEGDYVNKAKSGAQNFFDRLGKLLAGLLRIIGKVFGLLFILIGGATVIGLFFGGFSVGSIEILGLGEEFGQFPDFFYDSKIPLWLLTVAVFVVAGIPFLLLLLLGIRIVSNSNPMGKTTGLTFLGIWVISILMLIFSSLEFASTRMHEGWTVEEFELEIPSDTLSIEMSSSEDLLGYEDLRYFHEETIVKSDGNHFLYSNRLDLDIKPSKTGNAYLMVRKEANGRSLEDAKDNSQEIDYGFELQGNKLRLDSYYLSPLKNKFKDLELDVTIYLPETSLFYLDKSTKIFLEDVKNEQNIYDRDMPGHHYQVTQSDLKCLDCQLENLSQL
ncbi:PspC domain-containing protein [Flavobacteriaceae bacterium]|nr:PspC domain-containing protein [Flavobacteriaceae bacterium]